MKHSYEQIQREVRRRTRKYRRRYEQVTLTILSMLCLILSGSMLPLLSRAGMASSTVPGGYSSVLLHSGASAYVVVGIAAFVTGCIVTALCLYLKKRRSKRDYPARFGLRFLFCLYRLFHFLFLHFNSICHTVSINTDLPFSERSGEDRSEWTHPARP